MPRLSALSPLVRRRWKTALWIAALALTLLGVAERVFPALIARWFLPTGEAQWIWKKQERNSRGASAFYVVRDFDLEDPPPRARLLATADEEYVLYLNGKRVGSGGISPGPPTKPGVVLDTYQVGPLLLPGGNRLLAELRSSRGAGGFLASLSDGRTGAPIIWTDGSWRFFERDHIGLLRGWLPVGGAFGGGPAFPWGFPPTGRWGKPVPGPERPLFAALTNGRRPVPAVSLGRQIPDGELRGPRAAFDWGREVEGYLTLDLPAGEELGVGLLFTGAALPDPLREPAAGAVLVPPGSRTWTDARPRRFRYAVVLGFERPIHAVVWPVDPGAAKTLQPAARREDEIFGIEPPPLRSPVEDEVWRKFQRVARVPGGKEP